MRIALAQLNTVVGDLDDVGELVLTGDTAGRAGAVDDQVRGLGLEALGRRLLVVVARRVRGDGGDRTGAGVVYGCGPMPMLRSVTEVAAAHGAVAQVAVEESMACGVGVCMTCVLPVTGNDGVTRMVRSCVEGPVFLGDRVRWNDVGTVPADVLGAPMSTGGGH